MIRLPKALFIAATSIATTGIAFAQDADPPADPPVEATPPPTTDAAAAAPAGLPSLTLGKGKILIAGSTLNINLSADAVGKPVSIAPSIWYGVNEKLTLGVTHDGGSTQWSPRPAFRTISIPAAPPLPAITASAGAGICLTGEENGCNKVYDNIGIDALYGLKHGKFSLAAHPALDVFSFDPFALKLRVGVLGRYMATDKVAIVFDPRIGFGLTERDAGNKEVLDIPLWVWFSVNEKLGAYVSTGINGPLDGFGDAFSVPLQVGASFMVNAKLTAGLDFAFTNLIGKNGDADGRALGLRVAYAL